ncbi:lon-related putative ATP-dependent protease [Anaerovirgula multivorans]|uniref:endopeptidase La n=1 Tax=Anaerovirgula multivorans TaxID=312168 RepID=A0A239H4K1_9FIRM|nr:ATP-binding protein [Anaerovirgula multivorans]SNS76300.1 lon-related putative ATP-dependent protease [Anaerovirgula multivorans]
MEKHAELSYKQVKRYCDMENLSFETTEEVEPLKGIMGQKKGEEAMAFGLQIDNPSYNIYISGSKGTGRTTYTKEIVKKIASTGDVPDDWCYVYSFESSSKAMALNLPAGKGRALQEDMSELVEELFTQVPQAFNSDDYDRRRNEIMKQYQEQKSKLLHYLTEYADKKQFGIKNTSTGFVFIPLKDGEEMSDEELKLLNDEESRRLEIQLEEIQEAALDILLKIKNLERLAKKRLIQLEMKVGLFVVKPLIHDLIEKYVDCDNVLEYLRRVEKDLIENIYQFVSEEEETPNVSKKAETEDFVKKYKVNLLINNSGMKGAPVVTEFNPTLNKLTGKIEYENINGALRTDFLHIKPGAIHLANGGYLILEMKQLLEIPYAWETLKRILHTKEITVENMGSQLGIDVTSLKLEPIPIDLKIILIGSEHLYHLLYHYDEDFQKYFKVLVDFDYEMPRTAEHEKQIAAFISSYIECYGIRHFSADGVARLIEYSSRLTGDQNKLTTRFNKIIEIVIEANQWAKLEYSDIITGKQVDKAIHEKWARLNKYQTRVEETFETQKVLIDVKGEKVGVINGLSVINLGEYTFGKPSVITVTSGIGREGIVNIEREINLSGAIYDKGIMILTGLLTENFAQDTNLSITSSICFEQSYGGIDGDSASSGELYALLSSISGIPLRQDIAVTGSVNQKGDIQPVGGVTEKIEGFYRLCKNRGFTKSQGVMIPYQNIDNLMLCDEVVEAIKRKNFHIYAIKHIEEGIEIITGESYEKIFKEVKKKIEYYNQMIEKTNK